MVDLPLNVDSMVQGDGYFQPATPATDAYTTEGTDQNGVMGAPASMPAPVQGVSIATKQEDAPSTGAFQGTNLHPDFWLDPMKPHVSTEPQR